MASPRMDSLEPRRLFAFANAGASTIVGDGFQSVDKIVPLSGGGYVAAGLFSGPTTFSKGVLLTSRDDTDAFLELVVGKKSSTLAIGADTGNRLKFKDDRTDFGALPRRTTEDFPFGVSAIARRADEYISQVKIGPDGELYVALVFRDQTSLDTQNAKARVLTARDDFHGEYYDSAILRYSIQGSRLSFVSAMQIGGPFNDVIQDFTFDSAGNVLVSGSFERRCDFDPTSRVLSLNPLGRGDSFVAKYTRKGVLKWVAQLGGDTSEEAQIEAGYSIVAGPGDSVYVGGTFANDADFHLNGHAVQRDVVKVDNFTDAYTMRLSSDGALEWIRAQGGDDYDAVKALSPAPGGGVYNVGYFTNDADLDPRADHEQIVHANDRDSRGNDRTDLFFTRFDESGNVVIVKQLSGTGTELIASASTTAAGTLVIAGSYFGTLDIDPSGRTRLLTSPDSDNDDLNDSDRKQAYAGFAAVYSPQGQLRDVTQLVGQSEQDVFVTGAQLAADGRLAVSGRYRGGFNVIGSSTRVQTNTDFHDYREDGFSLLFDASLNPIA